MRHKTRIPKLLAWPPLLWLFSCAPPTSDWAETKELVRNRFPEVRQISVDELAQRLAATDTAPPLLVDVREREEYEVSHLPDAVWASNDDLERLVRDAGPDREIVLYCSVGYRSSSAAKELEESGFDNVANLEGSIFEWANAGHPVERGGQSVREVHPYDEEWGRLLKEDLRAYAPGERSSSR